MQVSLKITALIVIVFIIITYIRVKNQKMKTIKNEVIYIDKEDNGSCFYHKDVNCALIGSDIEPVALKEINKKGFEACELCFR